MRRYQGKLSGPLLDRFDLAVEVRRVARTLADLEAEACILERHLAEAVQYRRVVISPG